jgi:tetratricopeptide (TPR) repeat protein
MSAPPSSSRYRVVLICFLLAIGTFGLFWPVETFDFVGYDDPYYITSNPHVTSGLTAENIEWAFGNIASQATYWHPLSWISHMLDVQLFGLRPGPHHLVNLLFHTLNVLLLFLLLRRMTQSVWRSAAVAAIFAWHPIQVETVSWVTERKNVLSTLFFLLTLWAYARYVERLKAGETRESATPSDTTATPPPDSKVDAWMDILVAKLQAVLSNGNYLLVLGLFALGLMCKPMLVTVPAVLLLLDFWPLNRVTGGEGRVMRRFAPLVWEKIPLFVLAGISSVITLLAHEQLNYFLSTAKVPVAARVANALNSYARYVEKIVFPANLCAIYPFPPTIDLVAVTAAALFLTGVSYFAISSARTRPYFSMGWLWFLGTLIPVIGLVQVGAQAMADRFAYVPLIGILIMLVWGAAEVLEKTPARRLVAGLLAVGALVGCFVVSSHQLRFWENSFALFTRALAVTEQNPVAHYNLGYAYSLQGKTKDAAFHYREALRFSPSYNNARNNLAATLLSEGKVDEAIQQFHEMLRFDPRNSLAHYNTGALLSQQGKQDEALKEYRTALDLDPNNAEAHNNVGNALMRMGKLEEAAQQILEAVRLNPNNPQAQFSAGNILMQMQRIKEAIPHYAEAVRVKPDFSEAHLNLGNALAMDGQMEPALREFQEAARLKPGAADLRIPVGMAAAQLGRTDDAIKAYRDALQIKPDHVGALVNLGWILAASGNDKFRNGTEAVQLAARAVQATQTNDAGTLDLLAVAYAEAGKFPEATQTAEKALTLAEASGPKPLAEQIQSHLKQFKEGRPFRMPN